MANLSEEMKSPQRDLPRAIVWAIVISTVLYILVAIAAVSILNWAELSSSSAPLAAVAGKALGPNVNTIIAYIALASTANTVMLLLLAASRAMWAMSCAGVLPGSFLRYRRKPHTPWLAIAVVAGFTSLFALVRDIEHVAEFTNFAILIAFAGVNASAIKIFAINNKNGIRGFRNIFFNLVFPGAGVITTLLLAIATGWKAAALGDY
jgi:APA family basic amino acid/polyamine antiporter